MVEERMGDAQGLADAGASERYQLGEILAEGALCTVYAGHDAVLNRPIAVKAVPPAQVAVYRAALSATSTLAHPAAVITMDAIERDGRLLLAQEYVNGTALADRLATGLSPDLAVGMGLQLARLLAYVHARGMVHGDLTPTAVLIERDHIVRVNNFGLPPDAAYFGRFVGVGQVMMRGLSLPGAALDPEAEVTPDATPSLGSSEADIYALGLLLWQTLASPSSSGHAREFRADVPAAVRDIVGRLLVPAHPQHIATAVDLIPVLDAAAQALHAGHDEDDDQPTPSSLRQLRELFAMTQAAQPWSDAETIIQPPISQPLEPAYPAYPAYPAVPSGPLRAPTPSGPLRAPTPSGPLPLPEPYRGGPSGPLRLASPTGPLRAVGTRQFDNPPPPELARSRETRRLSVPNSGPLANAPVPQRAPTLSGPLRAGSTGRLEVTGPIPAYRPQAAVPWSDEPQVEEWSRRPASRPASRPVARGTGRGTAPSWPGTPSRIGMPARHGISLPPVLVLGLILLAICFIVGYFLPYILPFH